VRQGITNRDKVVDSIHEVLKQSFPETTRRQAMDLISGYGEFSPLDNDAVKAQTRDIRGQLQQVAKLEDIQANEPLKKTGVERRKPSDEERRLIREVNEAKKKYGVVTTDPATQLKSALDAAKTRMRNQIKDLTFQIETGEKPKAGEPAPTDEDLDSLRGLRDRVKQTLRDLEGDPKLTDEQRAKVATQSLERRISELKQRVQAGDASRKTSKPISTPHLEALRAERDALQAHVDEIRAADSQAAEERKFDAAMKAADELEKKLASGDIGTKAKIQGADSELVAEAKQRLKGLRETLSQAKANSPEAIAGKLDAAKRSVEDSISELDRRIQDEDFTTSKKSLPTSPELEALRAERDAMRQLFNKLKQATVPKLSAEQVALKALKSRIASRNAELLRRIADKDFTPNKRVPLDFSKDTEAVKLKAESDRLRKEFEKQRFEFEQAQRSKVRKTWDFIKESAAASRSLITSADISAPFRQGGFLLIGDLVTNPVKAGKQIGSMLHQLASEKAYDKAQASLSLRPNADLYQKSGLYFSDLDSKLSAREESMRGNLAEKIPVAGRIVRASNRAYTGFLNRQRADAFDAMVEALGGKDSITPDEAKIIANAVNAFTGRGSALGMEKAGAVAARYFFSPRNLASRFQVLLGQPIFGEARAGAALKARAMVAKQYAKFALGLAAIYGLASLAGAKISKDPKSSEFGKIRFGDTRIDPLAGLQQQIVILDRTLTGQQTVGGQQKPVDSDVYYRYIRSKLAPLPGAALDLRTGKNVVGDKVTPASALESLTVPMAYQDMGKIYKENGAVRGTILEMLNLMGMGLQNYRK
jgi:HAMP domain-containing protein